MAELPGRKRGMPEVRHLDHDAVDARLSASLLDYGQLTKEAGLTSEEAVTRLRRLLDDRSQPGAGLSGARRIAERLGRRVAWIVMALAGLALAVGLVVTSLLSDDSEPRVANVAAATTTSPLASSSQPVPPLGVTGFAEMFVAVYLGQAGENVEQVLEPFLTEPVQLLGLDPGRMYVQNVATVGVEPARNGWAVTVAAQTLRRLDGGYGDPLIQHYRVEVLENDGFASESLPSLVDGS